MELPYIQNKGWCPVCAATVGWQVRFRLQVHPAAVPVNPGSHPSSRQESAGDRSVIRVLECMVRENTLTVLEVRTGDHPFPHCVVGVEVVTPKPQPRPVPGAVPDLPGTLYAEGGLAEDAGLMRGAAALYRASVEAMCKDLGSTKGQLYDKIEGLSAAGVDAGLIENLHEARILGNFSLHDGIEFDRAEVADVAELIYEAFTLAYVQPAERLRMREARKARRES